jgi:hypothetical protein
MIDKRFTLQRNVHFMDYETMRSPATFERVHVLFSHPVSNYSNFTAFLSRRIDV